MKNNSKILTLSLVPAVLGISQQGADARKTAAKKDGRPNIIYIMTDQQAATAMSCAGNADLHTPNMDKLATNGVRFENAYCAFPLSGPARAAMFTGYMPSQTGMIENEMPLKDSLRANTLGSLVAAQGYDCAYAGKWHVNTISIPDGEFGFRKIYNNGDIGLAEACVDYLKGRESKKGEPFFLVASFTNPHNICEYARGQKTPHAPVPETALKDCPGLPQNYAVNPYDASVLRFEKAQNYSLYPTSSYSDDDWRQYRNAYYRLTEAVDAEIGKIVDEIDRQNLWENTVIIFTSDHGDGHGAHQWNQKTALYEEVVNVPFIVCLPGKVNAGSVSEALVNNGEDLMPSVCDWTGASVPKGRQGDSFRKDAETPSVLPASASASTVGFTFSESSEYGVDYIVTETNFNQTAGSVGWMVRTPKYKYVLYDKGQYREQLFDMTTDRGEMRNLAVEAKYEDILKSHRALLAQWLKSHPAPDRARHFRFLP